MKRALERADLDRKRTQLQDAEILFCPEARDPRSFSIAAAERYGIRVLPELVISGLLRKLPDGRVRVADRPGRGAFRATWAAIGTGSPRLSRSSRSSRSSGR